MRMRHFWTQNIPFAPTRTFFENPLMNLVSFIHADLHSKNLSQVFIC